MAVMTSSKASLLIAAIVLLVNHHGIGFCRAFHIIGRPRSSTSSPVRFGTHIFGSTLDVDNDASTPDGKPSSSMMTLNFFGETTVTSESAPSPATAQNDKSLHDFFALPDSAILLLRGSKNNQVDELERIDADLLKRYGQMCDRVDASPPSSVDRFFDVVTPGIQLPGLQVKSVAKIGVKMTTIQDLPGYELVLFSDATCAEGNRLFVWFFNKVTGKDKGNKEGASSDSGEQTTCSFNRISVIPTDDGKISFESHANLCVQIKFPSFLMKAIPGASQDKFEKTGGAALLKVLEEDCPGALELFRQEYVRWSEV